METAPEASQRTTAYQIPRAVLIRAWWTRLMFSRRTLLALSIWTAIAISCLFLPGDLRFMAILPIIFLLIAPINVYQLYARSVDSEPQLTDQKVLEFNASRLAFTGLDWRNEMTWNRFKGLSEDAEYFFLEMRSSRLAVVIPKNAFTADQQRLFREHAEQQIL